MSRDSEIDAKLKVTEAQKAANDAALDAAEKAKIAAMRQANAATAVADTSFSTPMTISGQTDGVAAIPKVVGANTAALQVKQAETTAARATAEAANPLLNKAVMPTDAPAGQHYTWIGGTTTGSWKLYKDVVIPDFSTIFQGLGGGGGGGGGGGSGAGGGGGGGGGGNGNSLTTEINPAGPTTNITALKSLLRGMGFNSSIIDSSSSFLMSLLAEGLDYDNAVSIFLDSKDYTLKNGVKITSPFYEQYGYLNEGLTNAKGASELYNFVEGSKGIIEKYGLSTKFITSDSLKKYVKNNVTVKDLDERANAARLKAINADPQYVQSLKLLGYLGASSDLTDFYLDPTIGQEKLESNRSTGAFTAEALRRANAGITTNAADLARYTQLTAGLQSKGLNEAQIGQAASEGFQNIANILQPEVGLSNIFEGANAANAQTIQQELESEQYQGTESERRKRLKELGTNIFNQSAGQFQGRITSYSNSSSAGAI